MDIIVVNYGRLTLLVNLFIVLLSLNPYLINKMTQELTVIKSNYVNEFRYTLKREEQKLLLYVISQIKEDEEVYKKGFEINLKDLFKVLELKNSGSKYSQVKKMTKKILEPAVIPDEDGVLFIMFFTKFHYNFKRGTVTVKMNPDLIDNFVNLKKQFVKYQLNNVMNLKSLYSIRIYEILKQNLYKQKVLYTVDELRRMLNIVETEYKVFSDFEKRVLLISLQEINEKTDIKFTFNKLFVGKKIGKIEFEIFENKSANNEIIDMETGQLSRKQDHLEAIEEGASTTLATKANTKQIQSSFQTELGTVEISRELTQKASVYDLNEVLLTKWVNQYGEEYILEKLELLNEGVKSGKVKSPKGFLITAIQQGWEGSQKQLQRSKEQQELEERKNNPQTYRMIPQDYPDEESFIIEEEKLINLFYKPSWTSSDMKEANVRWYG